MLSNRIILLDHFLEGLFRNGKNVRVHILNVLAIISLNKLISVDRQLFVGVYGDQNNTAVRIDLVVVQEAHFQVVQNWRKTKTYNKLYMKVIKQQRRDSSYLQVHSGN